MELKIISFNIRCTDDPDGHSIKERAPRLAEVTSKYDADILGLQEYRPAWEEHIEKIYGEEYYIFSKYRSDTELEASPILWKKNKFDCLKTGYFWLSDTPTIESKGWDDKFDCFRMCVYAILKEKVSGKTFTFMNTHLGFGDKWQVKSADLISEYRNKISNYPTCIVGDFNMTPDMPGYATMIKHFKDVNAVTANDWRTTYHEYNPALINDQHIDYCFVDKHITAISQVRIDDTVNGKYPSDHFGLYIKLDI